MDTDLDLPDDLTRRIKVLSQLAGKSPEALMVEMIEEYVGEMEVQRALSQRN